MGVGVKWYEWWLVGQADILQNAPFRSQIFKHFFALGGKGALAPLTKSLRTVLSAVKAKQATDISRLCLGEQFEHAKTQTDRRTETDRDRQQRHVKYDKISRHYASYASTAEHRYI